MPCRQRRDVNLNCFYVHASKQTSLAFLFISALSGTQRAEKNQSAVSKGSGVICYEQSWQGVNSKNACLCGALLSFLSLSETDSKSWIRPMGSQHVPLFHENF